MRLPALPVIAALIALPAFLLAGCAGPPDSAYVGGNARSGTAADAGRNAAGEACSQQAAGKSGSIDIFCGTWEQPSAHVRRASDGGASDPMQLATDSPWRNGLNSRFLCAAPRPTTILGSQPAALLDCARRNGGWPQVAMVAAVDGGIYYADGILPALPVMERTIGVASGRLQAGSAAPPSGADALMASRLAAQAFRSGDVGLYEQLMVAGTKANLAENYASAEQAFRAAMALQQKALGRDNPDVVNALMHASLQVSDQGRFAEATPLFAEAGRLAPRAADKVVAPRLLHYRALHAVNQRQDEEALRLLDRAEAGYGTLLPAGALDRRALPAQRVAATQFGASRFAGADSLPQEEVLIDPAQRAALIGAVEVRRYRAIVLRDLGRLPESEAAMVSSAGLASAYRLRQPILTARLYRTAATTAGTGGEVGAALAGLSRSSADFNVALPGTRPIADTELLRAAQLHARGRDEAAAELCRKAAGLLRELRAGTRPSLVESCLDVFAAVAARNGAGRQAALTDMFEIAQLAQGGLTSQQIALATARLGENAKNPRVGQAIRQQQDAQAALSDLYSRRAAAEQNRPIEEQQATPIAAAELDKRITEAQSAFADADAALQAASPNYGQLVQQVVTAADVFAALRPDEAFAGMTLTEKGGWTFLLHRNQIAIAPIGAGRAEVQGLVKRLRAGIELTGTGLPRFDTASAQRLYGVLLAGVEPQMRDATSLIVAPAGPLLSIPFGVLLTGPGDAGQLQAAPWLIRKVAVSHVPAAANFVSLRKIAGVSRASRPWFGFGDFRPPTLAQAQRAFPVSCVDSAKLFAGLAPLPFSRRELEAARALLGGSPQAELLGAGFTAPAVRNANLKDVRVLHFAAHALLPEELKCQSEPAIITSVPSGAPTAAGALLTASQVTGLDLDADAVILSACNSGGPSGTAGESLSGLARSFFYAGARALLVTHWSVNDQASAFLVADTLRRVRAGKDGGFAGSLRAASLGMIGDAGKGSPADLAHPFYWAPFALIGEGGGRSSVTAGL